MSRRLEIDNEEFRTRVAERLRMSRLIRENNQAAAATVLGVTPMAWCRYENGERPVPLIAIATFAAVYDICPRWLVLGDMSGLSPKVARALRTAFPDAMARYLEPVPHDAEPRAIADRVNAPKHSTLSRRTWGPDRKDCGELVRT